MSSKQRKQYDYVGAVTECLPFELNERNAFVRRILRRLVREAVRKCTDELIGVEVTRAKALADRIAKEILR